jgi:hypothetical protein
MSDEVLKEGLALAALIEKQIQRCSFALENRQEFRRLEQLQAKWQAWELQANEAGIDLVKEFGEKLKIVRPIVLKVNPFQRQHRTLNAYELHAIGSRQPQPSQPSNPHIVDGGIFSGQAKWF